MQSTGDAVDFGDLTDQNKSNRAAVNSNKSSLYVVDERSPVIEKTDIDYVTMSTLGNATDFGDLTEFECIKELVDSSNAIRAVFGGGWIIVHQNYHY